MTAIHGLMRKIALREEDLLHRTAAAAESAIEDFREANRRQRLSRDPPPAFWRRLSRPVPSERDGDQPGRWDQLHGQAVAEAAEAGGRVRLANLAHAPEAAAVFDDVRERIAQAARLPAGRRRNPPAPEGGDPSGPEGEGVHLVRRGRAYPRIEAAS